MFLNSENFLNSMNIRSLYKLGEGSFSKVILTEHRLGSARVRYACKIIDTKLMPATVVDKFLPRELNILPKINHPHIIKTVEIFENSGKHFILMAYAEQGDLLGFLIKHGRLKENFARIWFGQLVSALKYLHSNMICHRDIKCENILITADNTVKLSDFGFSRYFDEHTMSDTFCGSMLYAAPEIIAGIPYFPISSDIWSLGVVLFAMLSGRFPFVENNISRHYNAQISKKWSFDPNIYLRMSWQSIRLLSAMLESKLDRRITIDGIIESDWFNAG